MLKKQWGGNPPLSTYADANVGTRYEYNDKDQVIKETNRIDVETTYTYFETGEKQKEIFDIYEFEYNIAGLPVNIWVNKDDSTEPYAHYVYENDNAVMTLSETDTSSNATADESTGSVTAYDLVGKNTEIIYGNGQSVRYEYDSNGNLKRQYHNNDTSPYVTYTYNSDNELTQKINADTGLRYEYSGDNVNVYRISDDTLVQSYAQTVTEADEENNVEARTDVTENHFGTAYSSVIKDNSVSYSTGNNTVEYSYTENDNNIVSDSVKYNDSSAISSAYTYDANNNITKKALSYNEDNIDIVNQYDSEDKITATGYNSVNEYFNYDSNNQIKRVDNSIAENVDYTATYEYDDRGNVTEKNKYAYTRNSNITSSPTETTTFAYSNDGWNDKLISVNGTALTYDEIGNVLTYGDKEYTWSSGRNIESITDGDNTYSYVYDENGIRTSKTVNGVTTYYNTKDGVILSQTDGTNTMYFQYDTNGTPLGFVWNGTQYLYMTNQMGDVISITDAQGNELVQYEYDEWGKNILITAMNNQESETELANINPLRYRGYYYDNETGYYYLQSRYYDPSICRFINADAPEYAQIQKDITVGTNLFSYCYNSPISDSDTEGTVSDKIAIDRSKLKSKKTLTYKLTCNYAYGSLKFYLKITVIAGEYKKRNYAYLNEYEYKRLSILDGNRITEVRYSCGTSNTFYSQNVINAKGSSSTFKKSANSKWLAVNIVGFDNFKALIGCSVRIKFTRGNSKTYYILDVLLMTDEQHAELYTYKNGKNNGTFSFVPYSVS